MKKYILLLAVISITSCDHLKKHFDHMSGQEKKDSMAVNDTAIIKNTVDKKMTADSVLRSPSQK